MDSYVTLSTEGLLSSGTACSNTLVVKGRDTVDQPINVTCEVQQLLGNTRVRAIAMSATDSLTRGMEVIDTGAPISVPVGRVTLWRIFNVLGEPVDNLGPVHTRTTFPIPHLVEDYYPLAHWALDNIFIRVRIMRSGDTPFVN